MMDFQFILIRFADSEPQREYVLFEKVDGDLNGCLNQNEVDHIFLAFDVDRELHILSLLLH